MQSHVEERIDAILHCEVRTRSTKIQPCRYLWAIVLLYTLSNFVKFHIKLIWENYTTIENLEREDGQRSKFDIGPRRNLEQAPLSQRRSSARTPQERALADLRIFSSF